ncbi:hypothetical protein Tdes44962_MAKER05986 [Teratosphaeria destructans]|uniref:Uncharacterized protein n=1 Tax=Teratosphaeria destructans TaxID=418781 RepID=A0A9W7SIP7_9PEZI|nr:hypothetical protein Tdes44962_MAKER05986 [Teratosphaeria destructans]
MSPWRGWDEAQVRGRSVMGGFTAINVAAVLPESAQSTYAKQPAPRDAQQQSIASSYVGRGGAEASSVTAKRKKTAGSRGKKRATTEATASRAKRRKSSNVSNGLQVIKTSTQHEADSGTSTVVAESRPRLHSQPKPLTDANDELTEEASERAQPLSIFAQQTSMTSVQSVQQAGATTSVDAIRASKDYGHTVYDRRSASRTANDGAQIAQPWLQMDSTSAPPPGKKHRKSSRTKSRQAMDSHDCSETTAITAVPPRNQESGPSTPREALIDHHHLPTPVPSDAAVQAPSVRKQPRRKSQKAPQIQTDEECFLISDESDYGEMVKTAEEAEELARQDLTPPSRKIKENVRAVNPDDDYGGALFSAAEKELLHGIEQSNIQRAGPKPIVRKPFPDVMLDRSPIFGASNITSLRTCFRVGDAMNVGCRAVRMNKDVLLELYARVTRSHREEKPRRVQHFLFTDLYHDKPPHISGTLELCDQNRLLELDSRVFLDADKTQGGIMGRVMARMRRNGLKWRLEVLSIWEASWEDVEIVAGIYSKPGEEPWLEADEDV